MLTLNAFATLAILSTLVAGIPLPRNENEAVSFQSYVPTTVTTVGDDETLPGSQRTEKRGRLTTEGVTKLQKLGRIKPEPKPQPEPGPKLERLPNVKKGQKYESLVDILPQTRFTSQQRQFQKRASWLTVKAVLESAKKPKSQQPTPIQRQNQFKKNIYYQRQNEFPKNPPFQKLNQISKQPEPKPQAAGKLTKSKSF
ncbi:hypothetical protein HYALB_00001478 [Hymenoscyphus albidus]|uniref:Uncharacterized protein n=1 Tax=Hymenoscyphus albidus TaxID=595503 RepID=A0A9N9Q2R2_9HELO|nr:hypothetical protein HYALB_00001478 [Hymenoscyphus albidus]